MCKEKRLKLGACKLLQNEDASLYYIIKYQTCLPKKIYIYQTEQVHKTRGLSLSLSLSLNRTQFSVIDDVRIKATENR